MDFQTLFVAIVNATNTSQAFYIGQTDSQGFFQFASINNTADATGSPHTATQPTLPTRCTANHSLFGEGWSNTFIVEFNSTAAANVIINPLPAHIKIYSERNNVVADGSDKCQGLGLRN